jgi:hypothetical protein
MIMEVNSKVSDKEKILKLQTYVDAEDKEKYLFLKERLTAGADIPDSQVLRLIINRLHALETNKNFFDGSSLMQYTRQIERRLKTVEKELHYKSESKDSKKDE